MALNWQQLVGPAQVDDAEAAQRRLELAQALQARALKGSAPDGGGRVVAKYRLGHALTDVANGVVAGRNVSVAEKSMARQKAADSAKLDDAIKAYMGSTADDQVPAAAVQELRNTPDGQLMNPVTSRSEAVAGIAGATGLEGRKALAAALLEQGLKENDPSLKAQRAVEMYRIQGAREDKALDREARVAQAQAAADARIEAAKQAGATAQQIAEMRADSAREVAQIRADSVAAAAEAKAAAKPKLSPQGATAARAKLADVSILKMQLANLKTARDNLNPTTDTGYIAGGRQKFTKAAEAYDKALDALRTTVRKLTRTPGEGSMSNWEGMMAQAQLPERTVWNKETLDQGITQLEELANGYESLTREMLGEIPAAAPPPGAPPAAPPPAAAAPAAAPAGWGKATVVPP